MDPDSDQGHEQFVKIYCFFLKNFQNIFLLFLDKFSFFFYAKIG